MSFSPKVIFSVLSLATFIMAAGCAGESGQDTEEVDTETTAAEESALHAGNSIDVPHLGCIDTIGLTMVPTANLRPFVPAEFTLAGEPGPVSPLAIRTASCDHINVGWTNAPGHIVQVGALINNVDGTGFVNVYFMWWYTDNAPLAIAYQIRGVNMVYTHRIDYDYTQGALNEQVPFHVGVPGVGNNPAFDINGTVSEGDVHSGFFQGNWWAKNRRFTVRAQSNTFDQLVGTAQYTVTTNPKSKLGKVLGSGSAFLPILPQFNRLDYTQTITLQ